MFGWNCFRGKIKQANKRLNVVAIYLGVLIYGNPAMAQGWYSDFTISQLQFSRGADVVHVVFEGGSGSPNPDNCNLADRFVAALSSDQPAREKAMLAGLEAAYLTGKKVKVLLNGCLAGISGTTYPSIWYFYSM